MASTGLLLFTFAIKSGDERLVLLQLFEQLSTSLSDFLTGKQKTMSEKNKNVIF